MKFLILHFNEIFWISFLSNQWWNTCSLHFYFGGISEISEHKIKVKLSQLTLYTLYTSTISFFFNIVSFSAKTYWNWWTQKWSSTSNLLSFNFLLYRKTICTWCKRGLCEKDHPWDRHISWTKWVTIACGEAGLFRKDPSYRWSLWIITLIVLPITSFIITTISIKLGTDKYWG